jgi:hypothetical protein
MIVHAGGSAPSFMKLVVSGAGVGLAAPPFTETGGPGTLYGHANSKSGLGIGAARWENTPVFGVRPPVVEQFSSAGGIPILFDARGRRLQKPQVRQQPAVVAPDGASTVSFGRFFGTSAAAAHAAGIAALMKDLVPTLKPDVIYAAMKRTAIDMGFSAGFDFRTGFGLVQADKALNAVAPAPQSIPPPDPVALRPPLPPGAPPVVVRPPTNPPPEVPPVQPGPVAEVLCNGHRTTLVGTEQADTIIGSLGRDVIQGLGGNDLIIGGLGNDTLCGGRGQDRLFGGSGRDRLFGDAGRDRLNGGPGRDRCVGGRGDRVVKC